MYLPSRLCGVHMARSIGAKKSLLHRTEAKKRQHGYDPREPQPILEWVLGGQVLEHASPHHVCSTK